METTVTPIDGIVRPEWFGTTTSTTDNIQEAINLAAETGAKVLLEPRVYNITLPIQIYTATALEGTIYGGFDRQFYTGTIINYTGSGAAIEIHCTTNDNPRKNAKYTCLRFLLSNFTLTTSSNNAIGMWFHTSDSTTAPRSGVVENVRMYGFNTGIKINAISYVNFNNLSINDFVTGILIEKTNSGHYLEFARFDKIALETHKSNATGINLKDGNFLYFNQTDVNDCVRGLALEGKNSLHDVFIDKYHALRCTTAILLNAQYCHLTRIFISDASFHFSSNAGTYTGILFARASSNVISDCVFSRISDSQSWTEDNTHSYRFFYSAVTSLTESCTFSDLRVLNKVIGLGNAKKFSMTQAKACGSVSLPAGSSSVSVEIYTKNIFGSNFNVLEAIASGIAGATVSTSTSTGKLVLTLSVPSIASTPRTLTYLMPKLL